MLTLAFAPATKHFAMVSLLVVLRCRRVQSIVEVLIHTTSHTPVGTVLAFLLLPSNAGSLPSFLIRSQGNTTAGVAHSMKGSVYQPPQHEEAAANAFRDL